MVLDYLSPEWKLALEPEFQKPYFRKLIQSIENSYRSNPVFPPHNLVFNALNLCPLHKVKVVIIGQDPYHGAGQAHGLCFSVNDNIKPPPSLKNIFKELASDIDGFKIPSSGNLEKWARQGVLMLNAILTVNEGLPGSHKLLGWEIFTDAIIRVVNDKKEPVVFMLWGNYAITKKSLISEPHHLVLTAAHPSPLARTGFAGCRHFSKANAFLTQNGIEAINWNLI
jgi:uracil-DNA glycosylase